jgi:ribosomal protein S12 methylthiotransferase
VTGPHDTAAVMKAVHAHLPKPHDPYTDLGSAAGHQAHAGALCLSQDSEGCNHRCTFCIIPSMRGDLVSRPIGEVMLEAENLVKAGVQELLVISQDTSAYGVDIKYRTGFVAGRPTKTRMLDLCRALGELGVWVRLHYVYPYPHVDEVIALMAEGRILPYLDVPFQHAAPRILRLMKRPASAEKVLERIRACARSAPSSRCAAHSSSVFPGRPRPSFPSSSSSLKKRSSTASGASRIRRSRARPPMSCRARFRKR